MKKLLTMIFAGCMAVSMAGAASAAPATGDTYVYRVYNGYNNEARGQITYRVERTDADRITVAVTPDTPALGPARTEVYARDNNWLRHTLVNHDALVDYEFSPAYPAYAAPLDSGKSWSTRVAATNPVTGKRSRVRVDGEVLASERISTPAGAFDTVKVKRRTYAGDWEAFRGETNIVETEWYAPAIGRPVRAETDSVYHDQQKCSLLGSACSGVRGDWSIFELVSYSRK